jgi:hypothetical protein
MSRCKLRTPSPIHFKLRTVIGIDSLYWFLKKCCFQLYKYCINVQFMFMVQLLVKFKFFIQELWERKSLQISYECWWWAYHALLAQLLIRYMKLYCTFFKFYVYEQWYRKNPNNFSIEPISANPRIVLCSVV